MSRTSRGHVCSGSLTPTHVLTSFSCICTNTSNVPRSPVPPFGIMTQVKASVVVPVMAWQAATTEIRAQYSVNSVSFERFAVAFKLSVNCSSGLISHNSFGILGKSGISTLKMYNIPDYLRFFWQALRQVTNSYIGQAEVIFEICSVFTPLPHFL